MLLESSAVGARIELETIPKPEHLAWPDWLCAFPSFGYLLTTDHHALPALLESFHARGIAAARIGEITADQQLWVLENGDRALFRDLDQSPLTGLGPRTARPTTKKE
jgi:selenophosphate synthetase-related protein